MTFRKNEAFTMIEIMVVLFIIGLLATFVGPQVKRFFYKGNEAATKVYLNQVSDAISRYYMDIGHYPKKEEGSLRALVERPNRPDVASKWDGPYVEEEKLFDKWGNEFIYNCPPEKHKDVYRYFELISYGETGEEESGKEFHAGG